MLNARSLFREKNLAKFAQEQVQQREVSRPFVRNAKEMVKLFIVKDFLLSKQLVRDAMEKER